MTLGELKAELQNKYKIRQVGSLGRQVSSDRGFSNYTIVFSGDEKVVFPFGLKSVYFLTLDGREESTHVNSEKYKALIRAIERDR